MNDIKLLSLIAQGETEKLLLQKNLTRRLNALVANGLVDIYEGKILITLKGEQFQKDQKIIFQESAKLEKAMEEFSARSCRLNSIYAYFSLVLLCTAAVYLFITII